MNVPTDERDLIRRDSFVYVDECTVLSSSPLQDFFWALALLLLQVEKPFKSHLRHSSLLGHGP